MNKICTSLEQSKKLIELGIDVETADMYWWTYSKKYYRAAMEDGDFNKESDIPAWSLAALLSVLPTSTIDSSDDHYFRMYCQQKFSEWHDNPVDACYEMVVWLKENGYIKKGE